MSGEGSEALPNDWQKVRLGDLCKLTNGDAYKDQDWSDCGAPIIRIQNLNDSTKPFNYWAGSIERKVRVAEGDLLFCWSGTPSTSFGAHVWKRGPAVLNQHIFLVEPDKRIITREWLKHAFGALLPTIIGKAHGGSGLRHITKGKLEDVVIPVPPVPEQHRIADLLDAAMVEQARARSAVANQRESFRRLFDTCTTIQFEKDAAEFGTKPLRSFAAGADAFRDGPFGSLLKSEHYRPSGVRVIRLQNIEPDRFVSSHEAFVSEEHFHKISSHEAVPGDLIVAALGEGARPAGRACILPDLPTRAVVKADCFRVRLPSAKMRPEYAAAFLNCTNGMKQIARQLRGATRPRVNLTILREIEVPNAPPHAQSQTIAALSEIKAEAASSGIAAAGQLAAIDALPSAMLAAAFRGDL